MRGEFSFTPPDRGKMWADLALTIRQAAELTGVSERQIQHWLNQGYLPVSVNGERRISGNALDMIALIRQGRRAGIPLKRSVAMAREFIAEQAAGPLAGSNVVPETLSDLEEKLSAADMAIEAVRAVVQHLKETEQAESEPAMVLAE